MAEQAYSQHPRPADRAGASGHRAAGVRARPRPRSGRAAIAPNAPAPKSIDLARRGAESQREIIYSVRALLQIVARVYAKMPIDGRELQPIPDGADRQRAVDPRLVGRRHRRPDHMLDRVRRDRPERLRSAAFSECAAFPRFRAQRLPDQPRSSGAEPDRHLSGDRRRRQRQRRRAGGDQSAMDRRAGGDGGAASGRLGPAARRQRHAGRRLGRSGQVSSASRSPRKAWRTTCWRATKAR